MVLYLQDLLSDEKCFEKVRELHWPDGVVTCPHCGSAEVKKNGWLMSKQSARR